MKVDKLQLAWAAERVYGPRDAGPRNKPRYDYRASKFEHVQAIIAMLWPFLSRPKKDQAVSSFKEYHKHLLTRRAR